MADENTPPSPTSASKRRGSFPPNQKLSELFGRSPPSASGTSAYPGPIATAAANAQAQQRRRTSITGLGLAGSPTQTSTFANMKNRHSSFGSGSSPSTSVDENAVEDGDAAPIPSPTSPFARRMSFGARALRDVRTGNGNGNGRASDRLASVPSVKGRGEGFDWSENIKNRAERSASISNRPPPTASLGPTDHQRAASVAAAEQPAKDMPKSPKKPDHFQERILKGDFYMD